MSATSAGSENTTWKYGTGLVALVDLLWCLALWPRQAVKRALHLGDHAGGDAGVTRRRIQLVVSQKRLEDSDISAALKQVGREAVAQRMQRYALLDPGRLGRLVEQTVQLAGGHWLAAHPAGKQPAFLHRRSGIVARRARFPPLAQQIEHLRRQHDVAVLAALGLFDPNDLLGAVDMLDLQPHHLAGAQAAAIAETEHGADLEIVGNGQQPSRLVWAYDQRNLLWLAD